MEGIFIEFENENAIRSYPFACGNQVPDDPLMIIPPDVFVDAVLYPVNPDGGVYLSGISEDGVFSISDDTGVIMRGSQTGNRIELYDTSPFNRHSGTLVSSSEDVLSEFTNRGSEREYGRYEYRFSSSCVIPVIIDGVRSISVGESEPIDGDVVFSNGKSDQVRASGGVIDEKTSTLRFDIIPRPGIQEERSIRRVICVVDGQTPFRIKKYEDLSYNTVIVTLKGIDKDAVCAASHRENEYEMVDTCDCAPDPFPDTEQLPDTYNLEEVLIPPSDDNPDGAENSFYLIVPNLPGYSNPISITLEDGIVVPKTSEPEVVIDGNTAELADGEMLDDISSKGVVIHVPGLSGGSI